MSNERRRGGRNERRNQALQKIEQPPSFQPKHRFEPLRAVSDDELESIHNASLKVLSETGIAFLDETACRQLADAGASVDDQQVRFDPEMVMELISTAPSEFKVHGISPQRDFIMGGKWITYTAVASPPFVTCLGHDRRDAAG